MNLKKNWPATQIEVFKKAGHDEQRFNALIEKFAKRLSVRGGVGILQERKLNFLRIAG